MTKGLNSQDRKNSVLTKMPQNIDYLPFNTTTGMSPNFLDHNPDDVLDYLQSSVDYGKHKDNTLDCEDRAFLGIAHARARFPGLPMAAAIGIAVDKFKDQPHAVIAFWADKGKHFFYDAEVNVGREAKVGDLVRFNTKIAVPFPVYRPNSNEGKPADLFPFDKFKWRSGAAVLDRSYKLFDDDQFQKLRAYLNNKEYGRPKGPEDPNLSVVFRTHWEQSIEDQVLWAFANIRRNEEFQGYAVGMAFGTYVDENKVKDHALLVYWDKGGKPILRDLEKGTLKDQNAFKVRTLIV